MDKPLSFYKTTFQPTSPEQQAAFLEQLFERDADIRQQFELFIANWNDSPDNTPPIVSFVDLDELAEEIREELGSMSFDMESVYGYFEQGDRSYVPQYEAAWEGAENMLRQEGFEPYSKEARQFLKKGNLLDGSKILLAMYEGHNTVDEPGYDEEEVLQDYNYTCLDIFKKELQSLLFYYKEHNNETNAICQVLDLLIERSVFWQDNYDENLEEDDDIDRNVVYDLKVFEPLFLAVLGNSAIAAYLKKILLDNDLKNKETSKVFLKIAQLDTNSKDWVKTAEKFAKDDINIMRQLLAHYQKKGAEKDIYRIAKKAFHHFTYQMYQEVLAAITPEVDVDFYVKVLSYATRSGRVIEQYRLLKKYLTPEERQQFIAGQKNWMDFYVAMLAEEKRYEEILTILHHHKARADGWNSTEGRFSEMILHIIDQYPAECFQLLQKAVDTALRNGKGRGVYAGVSTWMAVMLKIKGYQSQARGYIDELVKKYHNFRALKDEMRKGGVL